MDFWKKMVKRKTNRKELRKREKVCMCMCVCERESKKIVRKFIYKARNKDLEQVL